MSKLNRNGMNLHPSQNADKVRDSKRKLAAPVPEDWDPNSCFKYNKLKCPGYYWKHLCSICDGDYPSKYHHKKPK